jgi:hypothetical protein
MPWVDYVNQGDKDLLHHTLGLINLLCLAISVIWKIK